MKKLLLMAVLFIAGWMNAKAMSTVEVVATVKPAIVSIQMFDKNNQPLMFGTGFFCGPYENWIVTNSHVVHGGSYITIHDLEGTRYKFSKIILDDPKADLAILQTETAGKKHLDINENLPLEGQNILVIGNPEGWTGTVSTGIVSSIRSNGLIQFTAPISPGSSGSPLVNENGEVLGVVAMSSSRPSQQNLNFAIAASRINLERDYLPGAKPLEKVPADPVQLPSTQIDTSYPRLTVSPSAATQFDKSSNNAIQEVDDAWAALSSQQREQLQPEQLAWEQYRYSLPTAHDRDETCRSRAKYLRSLVKH